VVSASQAFAALEPQSRQLTWRCANWRSSFPAVAAATLEKAALIKEVRATFTVPPGIDAARPTSNFAVAELCAGRGLDCQTGWPSTMESAARSGHHCSGEPYALPLVSPREFLNA
jgi:hypothetical protein